MKRLIKDDEYAFKFTFQEVRDLLGFFNEYLLMHPEPRGPHDTNHANAKKFYELFEFVFGGASQ